MKSGGGNSSQSAKYSAARSAPLESAGEKRSGRASNPSADLGAQLRTLLLRCTVCRDARRQHLTIYVLVKRFPICVWLRRSASLQPRTSSGDVFFAGVHYPRTTFFFEEAEPSCVFVNTQYLHDLHIRLSYEAKDITPAAPVARRTDSASSSDSMPPLATTGMPTAATTAAMAS